MKKDVHKGRLNKTGLKKLLSENGIACGLCRFFIYVTKILFQMDKELRTCKSDSIAWFIFNPD